MECAAQAPKEEIYRLLGVATPWAADPRWACVESGQFLFNRYLI